MKNELPSKPDKARLQQIKDKTNNEKLKSSIDERLKDKEVKK